MTASAAPLAVRKVLTSTVESRTIRCMFTVEGFDHLGDLFFLLLRGFVAGGLFGMYTCHYIKDALPSLFTLDHGHRLEEDAPLDGFGFEIGPFLQGKLLPQFSGGGSSVRPGGVSPAAWRGCSLG